MNSILRNTLYLLLLISFVSLVSSKKTQTQTELPNEGSTEDFALSLHDQTRQLKAAHIDKIFKKVSRGHWFNGTIIYIEQDEVVFKGAYGFSNFRTKDTLTTHSSFQLASVSKMFTATAIMMLKERGMLDYDDPVKMYLNDFPYASVTIRHLLTHRSGLSRYMSLTDKYWDHKQPLSNSKMLDLYNSKKPSPYFKSDKGFHYCNTNYALLACVVEAISKKDFEDFVDENIFNPLEMHDSFVLSNKDKKEIKGFVDSGVPGYRSGRRLYRHYDNYLNGVTGDKGVYSSVEDLYKFDKALNSGVLVNHETLSEAFTSGSPSYWKRKDNYGFGWRIKEKADSTVFHFGWWNGFRSYYIRDMKNQRTIIALSNKDKGPGSKFLWDIIRNPLPGEEG